MQISKDGMAFIIGYEGICPNPYLDNYPGGTWTIGIGITSHDGVDVKAFIGQPPQTIDHMVNQFKYHIQRYADDVNKAITRPISQHQFDALVSFHYNTGAIIRTDLTKLVNAKATDRIISNWWISHYITEKTSGKVMQGLLNRRKSEAAMFTKGQYGDGKTVWMEADKKGKQLKSTAKTINILPYL